MPCSVSRLDDVMQLDALKWAIKEKRRVPLPRPCSPLLKLPSWPAARDVGNLPTRHRLS